MLFNVCPPRGRFPPFGAAIPLVGDAFPHPFGTRLYSCPPLAISVPEASSGPDLS